MDEQLSTDPILDEALDHLPMEPLPPHFVNRVLAEVQQTPQAITHESFRLNYLDFLIPGFLLLFFVLTTAVIVIGSNWDVDLLSGGQFFVMSLKGTAVIFFALFIEMCLGIIAYFYLWSEQY